MNKKALRDVVTTLLIILLVIGVVTIIGGFIKIYFENSSEYIFVIDSTPMDSINVCGNNWNYIEKNFIACSIDGNPFIVQGILINTTRSPEDNCQNFNATFVPYNLKNMTRANEIYDSLRPSCQEMKASQITMDWLEKNTVCVIAKNTPFGTEGDDIKAEDCVVWKDADLLVIKM